jgi:transposase
MAKTKKRKSRSSWRLPEELWQRMQPLLPRYTQSRKGVRPRVELKAVAQGIFYVLRTGCQWMAVSQEYGSGSTVHRYFQQWTEAGVFRKL